MMRLRESRWASTFLVAVTFFAWLVASNHCAFASLGKPQPAGHPCCHETDKGSPASPKATQCCEAFNVPLPEHASVPAVPFHAVEPAWAEASSAPGATRGESLAEFSANAPPSGHGFSEVAFTRCVPAHAPPHSVA